MFGERVLIFFADAGVVGLVMVSTGMLVWVVTRAVALLRSRRASQANANDLADIVKEAVRHALSENHPDAYVRRSDLQRLEEHLDEELTALRRDVDAILHGSGPTTLRSERLPTLPPAASESAGGVLVEHEPDDC